jgi:hypothetical protein
MENLEKQNFIIYVTEQERAQESPSITIENNPKGLLMRPFFLRSFHEKIPVNFYFSN